MGVSLLTEPVFDGWLGIHPQKSPQRWRCGLDSPMKRSYWAAEVATGAEVPSTTGFGFGRMKATDVPPSPDSVDATRISQLFTGLCSWTVTVETKAAKVGRVGARAEANTPAAS
jgi:hypothetical protein